jgi:hypothetical protein
LTALVRDDAKEAVKIADLLVVCGFAFDPLVGEEAFRLGRLNDPTTGQLRSSSTDDIAAWFLDSDYDGDAFFVRQAYFTGAGDPYDKLRRALHADISEEAWDSVNSTISRPFPRPRSGKIAIKVINHYGHEVVKVVVK